MSFSGLTRFDPGRRPPAAGGEKDKANISAQDKAASIKTKQAGAESIGKYYSTSDGKYYGNYDQADKAQKARKAKLGVNPVKRKPITPPPKPAPKVYSPAGGGMGGGIGSKKSKPKKQVPKIPNGRDTRTNANQYGISR